ncbi:MAG: NupC/NupG family nucleoside CNT transporter [Clostridium sp.]|nr:NupC/NupG family nucleoside CNT transporter [Clostridium sp.]
MGTLLLNIIGIFLVLGVFFVISNDRKSIDFKLIGKALILQLLFTLFIVKVPVGIWLVKGFSDIVSYVLGYGTEGLRFVFGSLVEDPSIFVINALAGIIFVATLIGILNYFGVIELIVTILGGGLSKLLGVEKNESIVAVSNIFLGQTEAPLLLGKEKLSNMTESQLFLVLVSGMGSISASIIMAYANMSEAITMTNLIIGCSLVPLSSIIISKLYYPEANKEVTKKEEKEKKSIKLNKSDKDLMVCISDAYMNAGSMVLAITFSLIAIISLVSLANGILSNFGITLEGIVSYIFRPVAFFMGANGEANVLMSELLASKMISNEFVAFSTLASTSSIFGDRLLMMSTIMLLGFANISSIGITLSGVGILIPEKKELLAKLCPKAMIGGFAVSVLSALIVGLFI